MTRPWKEAIDGFDPDDPNYPERVNLTPDQKRWIIQAWTWASTALLGFNQPVVPDAIPRYNEKKGWHYVPAVSPDLNHITPVGESVRLHGEDDSTYNQPRNIAPVSRRSHTGRGMDWESVDEGEFVVHPDTLQAYKEYGAWKQDGGKGENPISVSHKKRQEATRRGEIYHDDSYDEAMRDLADRVVSGYQITHPQDKYPARKQKGVK